MGPQMPTHFDIAVLITVFSCVGVTGLIILGWMAWDAHKSAQKSFERGERLTRAITGLIVQESAKIRELMRD
jgi:hypothetical protein